MHAWNVFVPAVIIWLAACGTATPSAQSFAVATPESVPTPLATAGTPETLALFPTPIATSGIQPPLDLTFWVPEEFATGAEKGGDVLESQVAAFTAEHPDINIDYVLKSPYGKGGLVDWLAQLDELMPERLPDAAIVDSRELDQLERLGLLQPLGHELPSGAFWDLFPVAQRIARRDGVWVNQPLVLETEQLVYDTRRVGTPPATWDEVLETKNQFAFAADSTDTFLQNYLDNGGDLDPSKHATIDVGAVQEVLDYYQRAQANGNLNETTSVIKSAREVMPLFVSGKFPLAQVRARDYLSERGRLPFARSAPPPTRDGSGGALVSSWSFVILTPDPERQRAAAEYLAWLDDPARMAEWSAAAQMVPAGQGAFAQAIEPQSYADVLRQIIEQGIAAPEFSAQAPYTDAWRQATEAVLGGTLSPEDAAYRAVQSIQQ